MSVPSGGSPETQELEGSDMRGFIAAASQGDFVGKRSLRVDRPKKLYGSGGE